MKNKRKRTRNTSSNFHKSSDMSYSISSEEDFFNGTKYDFNKARQYLQQYGLRGGVPSLKSEWMKLLVNTQIYGGVGTIDDMLSYAGFNIERVLPSRKYRFVNFLQYYHIIEEVKRQRKGGRIFEITRFGEDLIEWAANH